MTWDNTYILAHSSAGEKPPMVELGSLLKGLQGWNQCLPCWALIWRLLRKIHFQADSCCWQNSVLSNWTIRSPYPAWLSARGRPQAAHRSSPCGPFCLGNGECHSYQTPLKPWISQTSSSMSSPAFKGLMWLGQAHPGHLHIVRSTVP